MVWQLIPIPFHRIPLVLYNYFNLRKNQWLDPSEIKKIQIKRLRTIIKHAYENVRFYHEKFKSIGIKPKDIKTPEDLIKIPILTKEEARKGFPNEIVAKGTNLRKCLKGEPSGSTGLPLHFIQDNSARDFIIASDLRRFLECGVRFYDKQVKICSPRTLPPSWFESLGLRVRFISYFDRVEDQIPMLMKIRPDFIFGRTSYLFLMAKAIKERGIREIRPRLTFTTAELLSKTVRKFINSVFETKIFDLYGCGEFGTIAWECKEHAGYHMDIDGVVVEFVKDGEAAAPGERGEIVCTGLHNYAMPLIRYKVGDVGVPSDEQCPCGRGLPLIKRVDGRTNDLIILPSGRILSNLALLNVMHQIYGDKSNISRFRIIQEKRDEFKVYIVKGKTFTSETLRQIEKKLGKLLDGDVRIETIVVDTIPPDKSGKLRSVISKVKKSLT